MIRKIKGILIIIMVALPLLCRAKESAPDTISVRRAFIEMPSGVLDLLSQDARLNMLDYYDVDSLRYKAINNLRGDSRIEELKPGYIRVALTPVSSIQLKVLKMTNGRDIVMSIYTTGLGNDRDSKVEFFDASLRKLETSKFLPDLKLKDFFSIPKGYQTSMKDIEEMIPFYSVWYEASAGSSTISGRLGYQEAVTLEDAKIIDMFALPSLTLGWNGKKFTLK